MFVLAAAVACTLFLGAGVAYFAARIPGYSHWRHTISELGEAGGP